MKRIIWMTALAIGGAAAAGAPSEIEKTVRAVNGQWDGTMTATVPGQKPENVPWTVDCRPIALGNGAACTMEGQASIGPLAQGCLLAFDPEGKAVHWMCVDSMGAVHDHRGQWKGDRIEFEPYPATWQGKKIVEEISWAFHGETFEKNEVVRLEGGAEMRFDIRGRPPPQVTF